VETLLTTQEAARLAGVTPSSVKRWADQGLLPCVKTGGGHRRFTSIEIERLRARQSKSEGLEADWVARLVRGRRHEIDGALLEARARLGAWYLVADRLGAVLAELGEQWACGKITIGQEHVATECLARGLVRVGDTLPSRYEGPRCALACAEDEEHTLALSLVELCLRELGWEPLWLGRRTPVSEIIDLVDAGSVQLVALSASTASDRRALANSSKRVGLACKRRSAGLALGGSGGWPDAPVFGQRVRSFSELRSYVESLSS
jgi:MerR family transcriptional regulator, light-induced transcriptional regulator